MYHFKTHTHTHRYIFAVTTMLFAQAFMHLLPKKYGTYVDSMCFQILVGFFVLQHTWALWVLYVVFFESKCASVFFFEALVKLPLLSCLLVRVFLRELTPRATTRFFLSSLVVVLKHTHSLTHSQQQVFWKRTQKSST